MVSHLIGQNKQRMAQIGQSWPLTHVLRVSLATHPLDDQGLSICALSN